MYSVGFADAYAPGAQVADQIQQTHLDGRQGALAESHRSVELGGL